MHLLTLLPSLLILSLPPSLSKSTTKQKSTPEKILLSTVSTLTLRSDRQTTSRRVPSIPQLTCTPPSICALHTPTLLQCQNAGSSYGKESIEWTCTASLPPEFKLGATDVICEGYSSPDDPYILRGSCGVEYTLLLTEKGEERFGDTLGGKWRVDEEQRTGGWERWVFWGLFFGVAGWIAWGAFAGRGGGGGGGGAGRNIGWGGGGGGGGGDDDDPPPPYDAPWYSRPGSGSGSKPSSWSQGAGQGQGTGGWNLGSGGFWSGAVGGAAAGYAANAWRNARQEQRESDRWARGGAGGGGMGGWGRNDNGGEGSSRSGSGSNSFSSSRYESTGFGGTSRR